MYTKTFTINGTYNYQCDIHGFAGMMGTIVVNFPLPAEFDHIKTFVNKAVCKVEWKTTVEQNISHFILQKSTNARDFTDVISINANHQPSVYSYADDMGSEKVIFYRIKIIDNDNQFKYSPISLANNDIKINSNKLLVYPNPFNEHFNIEVHSIDKWNGNVQIHDIMGRLIHSSKREFKEGVNYIHLHESQNYPTGYYTISIRNITTQEFMSIGIVRE